MSRWLAELGLAEAPPERLVGNDLAVIVWTARKLPAEAVLPDPAVARTAA